jgi:hypothetical protein
MNDRFSFDATCAQNCANAEELLRQGNGILKVRRIVGLGSRTVQRVKRETAQ